MHRVEISDKIYAMTEEVDLGTRFGEWRYYDAETNQLLAVVNYRDYCGAV